MISGGVMAMLMMKMSSRVQMAYAQAGTIVEQTVTAIRTVSFQVLIQPNLANRLLSSILLAIISKQVDLPISSSRKLKQCQ